MIAYRELVESLNKLNDDFPKRSEFSERLIAARDLCLNVIEECELEGFSKGRSLQGLRNLSKKCEDLSKKIESKAISTATEAREKMASLIALAVHSNPDVETFDPEMESNVSLVKRTGLVKCLSSNHIEVVRAPVLFYLKQKANPMIIKKMKSLGLNHLPQVGVFSWDKAPILCVSLTKYNETQINSIISYMMPSIITRMKRNISPVYNFFKKTKDFYAVLFVDTDHVTDFDFLRNQCLTFDLRVEKNA